MLSNNHQIIFLIDKSQINRLKLMFICFLLSVYLCPKIITLGDH
jgi:hypothetical protein